MRRLLTIFSALALSLAITAPARADTTPSGQRTLGNSTLEAAYDASHAGRIIYLQTPNNAPDPVKSNPRSWAPIYVPVYPVGTTAATTFSCAHMPADNCPDHGPAVAGAAQGISQQMGFGDVYADGVAGHDHVADPPGADDFNIAWEPVLVLFTSKAAANQHLITDAAIHAAADRGDVVLIPVAQLTFTCAVVSGATYNRGTPVTPV